MYGLYTLQTKINREMVYGVQDSFEEIAKDEDLTGETFRVLFYLYSKLDFENFIQQTQKRLQMDLRCKKTHVSRAMKVLTSKQIVLEGPKVGRSRCYRLNLTTAGRAKLKPFKNCERNNSKS